MNLFLKLSIFDNINCNIFNKREVHHNCTVEIWEHSNTGKISIGWYKGKECEE